MALSLATVGGKITAAFINAIIAAVESRGSTVVVPTVSGTGVTVSATTGLVTFASSTVITIDGCFSSAYRNYKIFIEAQGTAATLAMVLRTSVPADITSGYDKTEILGRNAIATSSTGASLSSWTIIGVSNTIHQVEITMSKPFDTLATSALMMGGVHSNPAVSNTSNAAYFDYLTHQATTSATGMKLTFSAAQSGTVRIVGIS